MASAHLTRDNRQVTLRPEASGAAVWVVVAHGELWVSEELVYETAMAGKEKTTHTILG
jgi:hypothetical protein